MSDLHEDYPHSIGGNPAPEPTPTGHKQTTLREILTPEQCDHVQNLMKQHQDPEELLPALKNYFRSIQAHLDTKGVLADYLAYVLYAKVTGVI